MKEKRMDQLLSLWGMDVTANQKGDHLWEIGADYILKRYNNQNEIEKYIHVMKAFAQVGVPTPMPMETLEGEDYGVWEEQYYLMMNRIEGKHLGNLFEGDYKSVSLQLGTVLGKIHEAFQLCEGKLSICQNSLLGELKGWIWNTLEENKFQYITKEEIQNCIDDLEKVYDQLPVQIIHRDFHCENVLFQDGQFVGCIDFDFSQRNIRIFDLCYFLIYLMAGKEEHPESISKWFEMTEAFTKGYEGILPLTKEEKETMPLVMMAIEILFVAFFISLKEEALAEGAAKLFYFAKNQKEQLGKIAKNR